MNKLFFGFVGGALYFISVVYLLSIGSGGMFFVFMCGWGCWIAYYRLGGMG